MKKKNPQYQFGRSISKCSLYLNQQIVSPYSKTCNVDNNGRVFIQPTLFYRYHSIGNTKQLFMCNKMSKALSKSSIFNNHRSIYNGARSYPFIGMGNHFDQDSNLMKHRGIQFSENHSKSNSVEMFFIKVLILLCIKRVRIGEKTSKRSECGNVLHQSSSLTQHQRIHTREER